VIRKRKILKFRSNGNQQTSRIRCSMFWNFKVITLSSAARGAMRPRVQGCRPWRHINTLYSDI